MPEIIEEDELVPLSEEDLEQPSETAEQRRAAIAATPIPETARPSIWNPKSRAGVRLATGIAAPTIAAAPFTGGMSILAGMGGAAAAEGIDALMSPGTPFSGEGEQPSLAGAAARVGAQGAIPLALGKVGKKLAPLAEKIPEVLPKVVTEGRAASLMRNIMHKSELFRLTTTEDKEILDGIVREANHHSPLIDAGDVLEKLSEHKPIFGQGEYNALVNTFKDAAKEGNGTLGLGEIHAILRKARAEALTRADRQAVNIAKKDLLDTMEQHIFEVHPEGAKAAEQFRRLNNEIGMKLGIAESAADLVKGNPLRAVMNIAQNRDAINTLRAFDAISGSSLAPELESLSGLILKEGNKASQAALLQAAQEDARKLLRGIITASAIGTGGMSNILMSILINRVPGGLPFEKTLALGAKGLAGVGQPLTAGVAHGVSAGIDALFPSEQPPESVAETDLEPETP
jgi:hypothetical protein